MSIFNSPSPVQFAKRIETIRKCKGKFQSSILALKIYYFKTSIVASTFNTGTWCGVSSKLRKKLSPKTNDYFEFFSFYLKSSLSFLCDKDVVGGFSMQ